MKTIDVCMSPEMMHLYEVHDKTVVVVDILRATSCMVTALANGVDHIIPIADLEECRAMGAAGYLTTGERNGETVPGFDHGNSPLEYTANMKGKKIAFTTTNGTVAIAKSAGAREIIIGAFLNQSAVKAHIINNDNDVLVVCAAWKGKVNLEDTLFAGALIDSLGQHVSPDNDAALIALQLYRNAGTDLVAFVNQSSHVRRLNRLNIHDDIRFCLTTDQYDVVPVMKEGRLTVV